LPEARMMMTGNGKPGRVELSVDDRVIAVIDDRKFDIDLGAIGYKVKRSGVLAPKYELVREDEVLIAAEQVPLLTRYRISCAGKLWMLRAAGLTSTTFNLFSDAEKVGRIAPAGLRIYKNIIIDLPDELSRPAQVFLVWLVLWNWSNSGS
jgi:hypothetical protein